MEYISFYHKQTGGIVNVRADAEDLLKEYRKNEEYMEFFEGDFCNGSSC